MKKVLLFASVCKPKSVLEITLPSYISLKREDFEIDFLFYNDNNEEEAKLYLNEFCEEHSNCRILSKIELNKGDYEDHQWNASRIDRIIAIKNQAISYAVDYQYDNLLLVDADLVLNSNTLQHLMAQNQHFIFTIFWTLFFGETIYKPNAWDYHSWSYKNSESILKLAKKGTYKVGGGGACTLLSREILLKGLSFDRLPSLAYQGEDRHFCTRAQALGYDVKVDNHFPAYHIFLNEQCNEAKQWYTDGAQPEFFNKWLDTKWKQNVIKSFERKDKNFIFKLKRFQYEIRKSFKRIFIDA